MTPFTMDKADEIVDFALQERRRLGFAPMTVAVLDTGGHVMVLKREDGAGILRCDLATGKAWGALGMGFAGREMARRAEKLPAFFASLAALADGKLIPVAGSALIRDADGALLGAIGMSGDTSDNDEICVVHAVRAVGLTADTGAQGAGHAKRGAGNARPQ